jgi:hypothetical protein
LGVKPAFEDVDVQGFLAFPCAMLKTKSSPTQIKKPQPLLTGVERVPEKDPLGEAMGQLLATLPEVSVHFAIG